jgi:hypothetical protein
MKQRLLLALLSLLSLTAYADIFTPYAPPENIYHVRSAVHGGSNTNNCTASKPCLTAAYAASVVTKPGSIIHVHTADGNFSEATTINLAKGVHFECDGRTVGKMIDTHVAHNENFILASSLGTEGNDNYQEIRFCDFDGNSLNGFDGMQIFARNNVKIHDVNMENWLSSAIIMSGRKDNAFDQPPNIFMTGAEIYNFTIANSSQSTGSESGAIQAGGTSGLKIHDGSLDSTVSTGRLPGQTGYLLKLSTPRGGFNKAVEVYKTTITKKRQENFDIAIELWNSYGGNLIHDNIIQGNVDTDMCQMTEYTWCTRVYNNKIGYDTYAPLPFNITAASWSAGVATLTLNVDAHITVGDVIRINGGASPTSWNNVGGNVSTWNSGTRVVTFPWASDPGTWVSGGYGGGPENGIGVELNQKGLEIYNNWFRNIRIGVSFYVHNKNLENLGSSRYRYGSFGDIYIHDNIAINAMLAMWNAPSGAPHGYNHNIQIEHNTVVNVDNPEAYCGIRIPEYSISDNIAVRSNIVVNWPQAGICLTSNTGVLVDNLSVENNLLYLNGNSNLTKIFTASAGQRLTNYIDQNNIIGDPLFMNFTLTPTAAGSILADKWYNINTVGTTNFTLIGASSNTVGLSFKTSKPLINVTSGLVTGVSYSIASPGTTNFTLIGSANNTVGTIFIATGPGSGSGAAYQLDSLGTGTGTVDGRDFRLQLASPAITTGLETPFLWDYRGRYRGANPDIGAVQACYNPSTCETGSYIMNQPAPIAPF